MSIPLPGLIGAVNESSNSPKRSTNHSRPASAVRTSSKGQSIHSDSSTDEEEEMELVPHHLFVASDNDPDNINNHAEDGEEDDLNNDELVNLTLSLFCGDFFEDASLFYFR